MTNPPVAPIDAPPPMDGDPDEVMSIDELRWILERAGVHEDATINSLSQCSSSFFVILFQKVFEAKLIGTASLHGDASGKLHNIQLVITLTEQLTRKSLPHISARQIFVGDPVHITRLLRVFQQELDMREEAAAQADGSTHRHRPSAGPHAAHPYVSMWMRDVEMPEDVNDQERPGAQAQADDDAVPATQWHPAMNGKVATTRRPPKSPTHQHAVVAVSVNDPPQRRPPVVNHCSEMTDAMRRSARIGRCTCCRLPEPEVASAAERAEAFALTVLPRGACVTRCGAGAGGAEVRRLDPAARDARIERIRAQRFMTDVHQTATSAVLRRSNEHLVEERARARRQMEVERRNLRDFKTYARDEDRRFREIYADAVASTVNDPRLAASRKAVRLAGSAVAERARAANSQVQASRFVAQQAAFTRRDRMERQYSLYVGGLCSWRAGSGLYA